MRNLLISRVEDEAFRQDETSDVRSMTYQLAINLFLDRDGPDWLIGLRALACLHDRRFAQISWFDSH